MRESTSASYPMAGGDGPYSYSRNSTYQKVAIDDARITVEKAITENFDTNASLSSLSSNSVRIADLGCSIGPNTFIAMQNIIDAVLKKYKSQGLVASHQMPELHVFYNDHVSNDFNALFSSLPPDRNYFAAGVPGSFHGRLFPESSLHVVYSSYALHWLSMVPQALLDRTSLAWNRGRVHYTNAPDEVGEAYAAQFAEDMKCFLDARSEELVAQGLVVLIIPTNPKEISHSHSLAGITYDILGSSLMDMAKDGIIREDQVDKFNFPIYVPSPEDLRLSIEKNGCFTIERMELRITSSSLVDSQTFTMNFRAASEEIISKHFGREIMDELFSRFHKKVEGSFHLLESLENKRAQFLIVLKRK